MVRDLPLAAPPESAHSGAVEEMQGGGNEMVLLKNSAGVWTDHNKSSSSTNSSNNSNSTSSSSSSSNNSSSNNSNLMLVYSHNVKANPRSTKAVVVRRAFMMCSLGVVFLASILDSISNHRHLAPNAATKTKTTNGASGPFAHKSVQHQQRHASWEDLQQSAFDNHLYQVMDDPYLSYPCLPRKIHVAQRNNVDAATNLVDMTLSFALDFEQCQNVTSTITYGRGLFGEGSTVQVDVEPNQFRFHSEITQEHYQSDWIYHVHIPDVQAGEQRYWYQITVQRQPPSTERHRHAAQLDHDGLLRSTARKNLLGETTTMGFVTPPSPGAPSTLALVGDLGQTENSTKTMNHVLRGTPSWWSPFFNERPITTILIAGDLSYADAEPQRWDRWLDLMEPLLSSTPMQSVPGNHEVECDNTTGDVFVPYENTFYNPNRIGPPDTQPVAEEQRLTLKRQSCRFPSIFLGHYNFGNAFYSFIHGLVHVIALNSYTDTGIGSPQYTWLEKLLETEVDREVTPWVLVMLHCPLHTSVSGHINGTNSVLMLENMEPLFVQYGINFVVSGHDHSYLRTHPMVGTERDPTGKGPIYLTLGAGGNREQHPAGFIHDEPEDWVAKRDNMEYGFGKLYVANATHARFRWVRDGTTQEGVNDDVWLQNQLYK